MAKSKANTRSQITVEVEPDLLALVVKEANGNFESNPEAVRRILAAHFANRADVTPGAVEPEDPNGQAALKRRKQLAEVQAIERKNDEATGELIPQAVALEEHIRAMTPVRQAVQQVTAAVDGLTDEQMAQLSKWTEDTLTNLSGGGDGG